MTDEAKTYIFKNRVIHPNGVATSPHTWEYLIFESDNVKAIRRVAAQPKLMKRLAERNGLIPASFADCRRMGAI